MAVPSLFICLLIYTLRVAANVTIYTVTGTGVSPQPTLCIGAVPCDGRVLNPIPNPTAPNLTQSVPVQLLASTTTGLSIPVSGSFMGFSLELSVANQLIGNDGNRIPSIFLNLMATVTSRAGKVLLRVGGNSQELASVVPQGLPNDTAIEKVQIGTDKTFTPTLLVSPSLLYAMGNISSLLNVNWFIGVPFNDTQNPRTEMAELSQKILGKNLLGMQLGNEPDLYFNNQIRLPNYTVSQYFDEFGAVLQDYGADSNVPNKNIFVAPSVCCGDGIGWTPEEVWNTGFLTSYASSLSYIAVQHYPQNNCNDSGPVDPQDLLPGFLNHNNVQGLSGPYINTSQIAAGMGKPLIMFETNTASCGGFSGLSDSFAAAMWAIDYSLAMVCSNFTNALFHVGGVSDYYNPFTVPAANQSHFRQWTISTTFYSALVTAEALGTSGKAQVTDLVLNNNNAFSPGYAVYENGSPARVVLINYLTDPSGASNYTAYISVGGNTTNTAAATPNSVQVKYLLAPSVGEKFNVTWAGQTFGGAFGSDGRLQGQEQIYTFACDMTNNVCAVPMPAPAVAVVYLNSQAFSESEPSATQTFATTTTATGIQNTATVAQAVLATSNGHGGDTPLGMGSTSFGSSNGGARGADAMLATGVSLLAVAFCGVALWRR